jgi:membrane fusion protein (multidrug efflux system)
VEERPDRLSVPKDSVVQDADGKGTVALVSGGKATTKTVKIGVRDGDQVEIEGEGLQEGALVVTIGAYGLPRETKVRVIGE